MERNRESRRTASTSPGGILSASRRPRPKDASDDEDGTDDVSESRVWERPRKEKPTTIHVSNPNLRNKRKRHGVSQEPNYASGRTTLTTENAEESAEDAEMAASEDEEDDDEPPPPPPPPPPRRPLKSRSHAKEDEIVMDIPPVPRKARSSISSSSRFSLASRRQLDAVPTDIIRNKSPGQTQRLLNGSSAPTFLQKAGKKLKPAAPKFHPMKYPKVSEPTTISDQEAEVAEALYVLARSTPTSTGLLEPKIKARQDTDDQTFSPAVAIASTSVTNNSSQDVDSTLNGHVKDSNKPTAEAPKRKRPRVVCKPEEGKLCSPAQHSVASTVSSANPSTGKMELEPSLERSQIISTSAATVSSDLLKCKDSSHSLERQLHNDDDIKVTHEGKDCSEPKIANKDGPESNTDVGDQQSSCSDVVPSNIKQRCSTASDVQVANDGDNKELSDRPADVLDGISESSKSDIDLMRRAEDIPCTPLTRPLSDDGACIHSTNKKIKVEEGELPKASSKETANATSNERVKQETVNRTINHKEVDLQNTQWIKESVEEKESSKPYSKAQKNDADNIVSTTSAPMVSSAAANCSTAMAVGWIGGLPPIGYYGAGSIPWAAGAPMPNSNDVFNASHTAMQMPHAAILPPVARMKRCATHVYLAHLICRAQAQVSRQSLWSAALCRAPYNLNMPPVNIHDNDQLGTYVDIARKVSAQQPGSSYSFTVPQSSSPGMPGCSSANASISASNHSTNSGNIDSGDNTNVGHLMASTAPQLQYLQAVMQQNGFPSFPFRFSGPPGQAAQFFSSPFFPPHLLPPIPQLPPLGQQAATGLPMQKQQQGMSTAQQQSSSSQQIGPPRSPPHSQSQHGHVGVPITFGSHPERERTHGGEIVSKAENRMSPMQRNTNDQGSSKLPNLNISPVLTTNMPVMHPHEQDNPVMATISGGKHHFRSQQQVSYENQAQPLPMHQQQYIQPNTGSVPGHQINQSSQGYPAIALSGAGRGTAGPLGLMSVSPMMAQGHGLLLASAENTRINIQQQKQSYESHNTQYQAATKKTNISNEDPYKIIGRDQSEDKKMPGKQTGSISQPSMIELEVSSPTVQVSATSGSTGWLNSNMGRSPTSTILPDTQGSKQTSSGMVGQHNSAINSQQTKQSTSRTKGSSVTNLNVYGYMDKGLHGNLGKIPGTMLPYTPQSVTSSQGSKQSQAGVMKNGQKMSPAPIQQATSTTSKSQGQQSRNSQQQAVLSTPLKMMPSAVPTATMPLGTLPMGSSHLLPASKSAVVTASKSSSNGKGVNSGNKSTSAAKKPSASSPSGTSAINSAQSMSAKGSTATIQQKSHAVHVSHFPQPQTLIPVQQSRMPNKAQLHSQSQSQTQQGQYKQSLQQLSPNQQQLFMQHQQYLQSPQSTSQPQLAMQHHYQQHSSLPSQHGQTQQLSQDTRTLHLPRQIQPVSLSQSTGLNGLSLSSSSFTIGTAIPGHINGDTSLDGTDQFKGSTVRGHSSKAAYSSGGLPSTESVTKLHPGVSGQVSPHNSSSQYMQATSVKSVDQKPSSDANREEIGSAATHVAVTSNPIS